VRLKQRAKNPIKNCCLHYHEKRAETKLQNHISQIEKIHVPSSVIMWKKQMTQWKPASTKTRKRVTAGAIVRPLKENQEPKKQKWGPKRTPQPRFVFPSKKNTWASSLQLRL
jgi:hypothetical protein